jgi:RimJ/RimL family protein N-acetyltransferase
MTPIFSLNTERLLIRSFNIADAPTVQKLAGDRVIADTTRIVPHPYLDGLAEEWIQSQQPPGPESTTIELAITLRQDTTLVGAISLVAINRQDSRAELGYWIGKPFWGKGYCTEAASEILRYAFETVRLNRVSARHLARNPASGRVLEKIGMSREGCLRQDNKKWDIFEDVVVHGILAAEWADVQGNTR